MAADRSGQTEACMQESKDEGPAKAGRTHWGSRTGFVLAAAGSAVGLGNIWKFPYITGENGGGLFVLIYLVCIALVGLPILIAEIMIGRAAQAQPVEAFKRLQGGPTGWSAVGWLGVVAGFLILSFYIVVAGWAMDYTLKSVVGFTNPISQKAEDAAVVYRGTVGVDSMRDTLIAQEASEPTEDAVRAWRRQFAPSTWEAWEVYERAASKPGVDHELILQDPLIKAAYEAVSPELADREAAVDEAKATAAASVAALSDDEVREAATTLKRRSIISGEVTDVFMGLLKDGWTSTFWAAIFMFLTILVVASGVGAGIERTCRVLMPLLMLFIVFLVVYGFFQPGFGQAVSFVFSPDPNELEPRGVLEALGHAFFTLSLGMGAMVTYGSYQRRGGGGLMGESVSIAIFDTSIALLACLMMFPIIFSYGQDPSSGPGLVFMSMPLAFAEMGELGMMLGIVFFGLLVFAALTSAISLLEVVASYLIDAHAWSRPKAAWTLGGVIFAFGIITAFANSAGFRMTSWLPGYGQSFFDTMDLLTSNWMLPLGGLLIAIYAGWIMPARIRNAELSDLSGPVATGWLFLVRFVAPLLVVVVLLDKVGLIDVNEISFQLMH
ncbi:MAG: sodium-dependent transporter [Phycisphaerales bacterium]|jgi:NSS family neurotransmitter:Na+ symporter|nr:sodium-dependent transporter [Phycisphaerales bacterium]